MFKEQSAFARRILNDYRRGKFDIYLAGLRQEVKDNPASSELLQKYLHHYYQRHDWSDLDKDIQAFVDSLLPVHHPDKIDINRLISRCIRIQSNFTQFTGVGGFTKDFVDIESCGGGKEYVYNVAPIHLVQHESPESPYENIFFFEEHGGKMACRLDDDIIISGHCMWWRAERVGDENLNRLVFVKQYVKP